MRSGALPTRPLERYTDEAIQRDWMAIRDLSSWLGQRWSVMDPYAAFQARFLIDFAVSEYHENDRSGVIAWALDAATERVDAPTPAAQRAIALASPPLGRHDELGLLVQDANAWNDFIQARERPGALTCAPEPLARYYVSLLILAHERWEVAAGLQEPGHEKEGLELVADGHERFESALKAKAGERCMPKSRPPKPLRRIAPIVPPRSTATKMRSEQVRFAFNGYRRKDLLDDAERKLADIAHRWWRKADELEARGAPPLAPIELIAHADRIGSPAYNYRLAALRAQTVKGILVEYGVPAESIRIHSRGSEETIAGECDARARARLIACLAPDRRVEVRVPSVAFEDLAR